MMGRNTLSRRGFLKIAGIGAAGLSAAGFGATAGDAARQGKPAAGTGRTPGRGVDGMVPTRPFGTTGERVAMLGLGGWHLGSVGDDREAIDLCRRAIDLGVTFMDNAWGYHRGRGEEIMGRALQDGYREKVFLMTKHQAREDSQVAMRHLEDSLRRLRTDALDLWQFHAIGRGDAEKIFSAGGAIEAARRAKEQGKVRLIGFSGHGAPAHMLSMLAQDWPWDAVQMPINVLDIHYRSFHAEVLAALRARGIACIAMKALSGGRLLRSGAVEPADALRWVWSQPVATTVVGMDSRDVLEANVATARSWLPMTVDEQQALLEKTKAPGEGGTFEWYKSARRVSGKGGLEHHDDPRDA